MTGIIGGEVTQSQFDTLVDEMWQESWYETERFRRNGLGVASVNHGRKDPKGRLVWRQDERVGIVYGSITNRDELGLPAGELFAQLLDRPKQLLPRLDGSFTIACVDALAGKVVLATDKLGTRPCFYAHGDRFLFGTEVGALLSQIDRPEIDEQGVSDLLLMGHLWGERTLVTDVSALPSGSVLEFSDGEVDVSRYWEHEFESTDADGYVNDLVSLYRRVISDMAETMDGAVGIWLSGGLDSRTMASELSQTFDSMRSYTYDANPAGGGNPELARQVAEEIGIENEQIDLTPDRFLDVLEESVAITDGMVGWKTLLNISSVFNLPDDPNVVLEASGQGGLLGYDVWQTTLDRSSTPTEALYKSDHLMETDQVTEILTSDVDPMDSYRIEVEKSSAEDFDGKVLDAYYRNFYPRGDFASNQLAQSQVGTRVPFANGDFLRHVARMPEEYRARAIPLTGGKVPYGTSQLKLELSRKLDGTLDELPYERTGVPPEKPLWMHAAGFVATKSIDLAMSKTTYGGKKLSGEWYRHHDGFQKRINDLLDSASERPLFDEEVLRRLQSEHLNGEGEHIDAISGVTTIELWLQRYLD